MRVQGLLGDSEARPEASKAAVARGLSWLQCLMLFASSSFLCVLCTSMMTFLWERRKGSQSQVAATCKSEQGEPMCRPSTQTAFPGEAGHLGKDCKTQHSGLRSKEEKLRDPINQLSRCNTQEGLLSVT